METPNNAITDNVTDVQPNDLTDEEKCLELIKKIYSKPMNEITDIDQLIADQDYYCALIYARIINYNFDIFARVISSVEGRAALARKGLFELSLIDGAINWKS